MGQYAINDVTPGESAELTFTVKGLEVGETVSNATLEIRSRDGSVVVPVKTVTGTQTVDGVIEVSGSTTSVIFNLSANETLAIHPRQPYYLFAVNVTTSLGRRQAIVPIGRINPSQGLGTVPIVRLGSASLSIKLQSVNVTGSKV